MMRYLPAIVAPISNTPGPGYVAERAPSRSPPPTTDGRGNRVRFVGEFASFRADLRRLNDVLTHAPCVLGRENGVPTGDHAWYARCRHHGERVRTPTPR